MPGDMHCMPVSNNYIHSRGSECKETCTACLLAATTLHAGDQSARRHACMPVSSNYTAGDQSARRHACMPVSSNYTAGDQSAGRHALHAC